MKMVLKFSFRELLQVHNKINDHKIKGETFSDFILIKLRR